ncbi:MAG: 3-phosphoshikimate 1-carboxyvinyltransferase [Prevotella sp.]|jgi:3-phosphoshikimate 1-carboxyvinyltransferase
MNKTTYRLTPSPTLNATITLPASKSISNRALIINALAGGTSSPINLSCCDDTKVVINALNLKPDIIDIKASGTAMRFMTAYLAVTQGEHILTGTKRMKQRPIGVLVDALNKLGADISYEAEPGYPPLRINGKPLPGGRLDISGDVSSQYISALLMIGPVLQVGLELHLVGEIVSRPYIDLTLYMMKRFGADADWTGGDVITVRPQNYTSMPFVIENDWTSASYWYELLALNDDPTACIRLNGLGDGSKQGDSAVKYIFSLLGIKTTFADAEGVQPTTVTLSHRLNRVQRLDFDFMNCPDLAQTVVATCCALDIPFHFKGLGSLKIKETDRIEALKKELCKLGYLIRSKNDSELIWDNDRCEPTFEPIDTYEDHRMAMAFAPLAIKYPGLCINNPKVVSKSYPRFWNDLKLAGFKIESL